MASDGAAGYGRCVPGERRAVGAAAPIASIAVAMDIAPDAEGRLRAAAQLDALGVVALCRAEEEGHRETDIRLAYRLLLVARDGKRRDLAFMALGRLSPDEERTLRIRSVICEAWSAQ